MEKRGKKPSDTLEQVVADAIERERLINEQHPERHGYGMIQGEANDLIRRIEHLNNNQMKAQAAKIKNREDRIRVIGSDKLYTHSPEEIIIEKMDREQVSRAEKRVFNSLSQRSKKFYLLHDDGLNYTNIAKLFNIHRSTVSRDVKKIKEKLKEELQKIKESGDNYVFV